MNQHVSAAIDLHRSNYRVPAFHIILAENSPSSKIQIFRVGTFHHPQYGKFEITKNLLSELKKNFDSRVRGIDIMVDYKHDSDGEAAGWIKGLELSDDQDELWADVEWTPTGKKVLSDKEFRYISPEFSFNYQDNETLKDHGAVLLGAGLTNRPVIKKMEPVIELSEYKLADSEREKLQKELLSRSTKYGIEATSDAHLTPPSGGPQNESDFGDPVNYKFPLQDKAQIANARVRFKQFANQTYNQAKSRNIVHERIVRAELAAGIKPSFDSKDPLDASLPNDIKEKIKPDGGKPMSDQKKMEEMSPEEMKALIEQLKAELEKLKGEKESAMAESAKLQEEKKYAEKKSSFQKLLAEGRVCAAQEESYLSGDMVKFIERAQPIKLSESGSATTPPPADKGGDVDDKIMKLAEELVVAKKAKDYSEAFQRVMREHPELVKEKYN